MGKRELLLIVCFVIVGAGVYQVTAPEPGPGQRGFSFSRFLEAARREQATAGSHDQYSDPSWGRPAAHCPLFVKD